MIAPSYNKKAVTLVIARPETHEHKDAGPVYVYDYGQTGCPCIAIFDTLKRAAAWKKIVYVSYVHPRWQMESKHGLHDIYFTT